MSATFFEKGVIEPAYAVGEAVWVVEQTTGEVTHPCPDCHGTQEWDATSPAGNTIKIVCPRCSSNYSSYEGLHGDKLPALSYRKAVFSAKAVNVLGIEIRDWNGEDRVSYRVKTNGGHYSEKSIYPTEQVAVAVAAINQAESDAKVEASPKAVAVGRFSTVTMLDATVKALGESLWRAWYRARQLVEEAENYLGEEGGYGGYAWSERAQMLLEEAQRTNPYIDYGPMEKLMGHVEALAKSDPELAGYLAAALPARTKAGEE